MTFRSRARGGSWFEKRLARIAESGNQSVERVLNAPG